MGRTISNKTARELQAVIRDHRSREQKPPAAPPPAGIGAPRRMVVLAVTADYLKCRLWDGKETGPADIYVARPWALRKTGWDGVTRDGYTYSDFAADGSTRKKKKTGETTTTTETLSPAYVPAAGDWPGDEITAQPANTGLADPNGDPITLVDDNSHGRQWTTEAAASLAILKYTGTRSGKRYTGQVIEDDGTASGACQFQLLNDPGTNDLLNANDVVLAIPAPSWFTTGWSGEDPKYLAMLSPWSALR